MELNEQSLQRDSDADRAELPTVGSVALDHEETDKKSSHTVQGELPREDNHDQMMAKVWHDIGGQDFDPEKVTEARGKLVAKQNTDMEEGPFPATPSMEVLHMVLSAVT